MEILTIKIVLAVIFTLSVVAKFTGKTKSTFEDLSSVQLLIKQLNNRVNTLNEHVYGKELLYHTFYIFLYEVYGLSKKYAVPFHHHVTRKENLVKNFTQLVRKQLCDFVSLIRTPTPESINLF